MICKKKIYEFSLLLQKVIFTHNLFEFFSHKVTFIEKNELKLLENYFKGMIEQTLLYLKSVTEYSLRVKNASAKYRKYWKAVIFESVEILNKVSHSNTSKRKILFKYHDV